MRTNKIVNILILMAFGAVIFIMGIFSLVLPKPTASESEKRELAKMPIFSLQSLFGGKYTSQIDIFYADTFPFREGFVSLSAGVKDLRGLAYDGIRLNKIGLLATNQDDKKEETTGNKGGDNNIPNTTPSQNTQNQQDDTTNAVKPGEQTQKPTPNQQTNQGNKPVDEQPDDALFEKRDNVFIYGNAAFEIFGTSKANEVEYARVISEYKKLLGSEINVFSIVVPTSVEFNLPEKYSSLTTPQKPTIDNIYANMSKEVIQINPYDEIKSHKGEYMYFRTDHHWTGLGAYYAYKVFAEKAGFTPYDYEQYEKNRIEGFLGSLYSSTNSTALKKTPDYVEYCNSPVNTEAYLYQNASLSSPAQVPLYPSYAKGVNSYSVFVHGDNPLFKVKNLESNTGKKILVIKESYGNALAPYFIPHYDELYVVDFRMFKNNIINFINENGITDVVIVNNAFAAITKMHGDSIRKLLYN